MKDIGGFARCVGVCPGSIGGKSDCTSTPIWTASVLNLIAHIDVSEESEVREKALIYRKESGKVKGVTCCIYSRCGIISDDTPHTFPAGPDVLALVP